MIDCGSMVFLIARSIYECKHKKLSLDGLPEVQARVKN